MARAKQSRKGKKEWRRNISTAGHDAFVERAGKEERSGGPLDRVPDEGIFFVDRAKAQPAKLRKVDLARQKVLHSDSVLKRASLVPPVAWSAPRPKKLLPKDQSKEQKQGQGKDMLLTVGKRKEKGNAALKDLWAQEDLAGDTREVAAGAAAVIGAPKPKRRRTLSSGDALGVELPAVEVDAPGCSFNPAFEEHQEVLAAAVAEEVQKETKKELQPSAPLLQLAHPGALEAAAAEMEMYQGLEGLLPEDSGLSAAVAEFARNAMGNAAAEENGDSDNEQPGPVTRPVRVKKLTRADLNRRLRRRAQEHAREVKLKKKRLHKDAERAAEIGAELTEEAQEAETRRQRRAAARREKRLEAPPRLGKHRYEPEPVNVMLSDEVTGSLRQVKGCFTLARDRFKSLQKRGILEPRVPVKRTPAKRRRIVEQGSKGNLEREMHAEILQMRAARRAAKHGSSNLIVVE